jgi:hypothetical protein
VSFQLSQAAEMGNPRCMSVLPIFSSPFFTVPLTLSMLLRFAVCIDCSSGQISQTRLSWR